jgi:adenylate kinase
MEAGEYVPDDITIQMVMEWVNAPSQAGGFVLDGFPRTSGQAEALDRGAASLGGIDQVVYMAVPRDELMRRLTGRLVCRGCQTPYHIDSAPPAVEGKCDRCGGELYQRKDDGRDVVERRLQVYEQETEPVIDYYRRTGKFTSIDATGTTEEVKQALAAATAQLVGSQRVM